MIGFMLAAGMGTRLRPLTDHVPKAMVPVCGEPLLGRSLDLLNRSGFSPLGVNVHYLPERIFDFRERCTVGFSIFHETGAIRGTGGALFFARAFLSADEAFCVCNADILSTADLRGLGERFLASDCSCALIAVPPADGKRGTVRYSSSSAEYAGLSAERDDVPEADFIGIAFYRREALDSLRGDDFSIVPVWRRLQEHGRSVRVWVVEDIDWLDIGTPSALAAVHDEVLEDTRTLSVSSARYTIDRTRRVACPHALREAAARAPWRYVWSDAVEVSETARLRHCLILDGAVVRQGEDLSHCIRTPWGDIASA